MLGARTRRKIGPVMGELSPRYPAGRRFGLLTVLLVCVGSLVLATVGPIIAVNSATARAIFWQMADRVVVRSVEGLEVALRDHLDPANDLAEFIAENAGSGVVALGEPDKLAEFATGALAAARNVTALVIADAGGSAVWAGRGQLGAVARKALDVSSNPRLAQIDREARGRKDAYWGPPVFSRELDATVLNLRVPLWRGDAYLGFAAIGMSTQALSEMVLAMSEAPRSRAFVLDGDGHVLAHMFLALQPGAVSAERPLLNVDELIDPVMQHLGAASPLSTLPQTEGIEVTELEAEGAHYIVLRKAIAGYGDRPLVVGAYADASTVDALLHSMSRAILIGVGVLAGALVLAFALSRRVTTPIAAASEAATAIAALDFDRVPSLPRSRIREIDSLAASFDAMLVGLKSFSRYAPIALVRRLMRGNRVGAGTEEKHIAVMFTDIAGFTSTCEGMTPEAVASFVNHHLALVSGCIEQEGGTIDKYIGDAVMAFWGAPEDVDNPPLRAIRAALAIQSALAADNAQRASEGLPPVRIRIGVHAGPLVVGDIGAPNRINYTVIGDVVNVAQRLEALGKEVEPQAESIVLFSEAVRDALGGDIAVDAVGPVTMRGKRGEVQVFRLEGPGRSRRGGAMA